MEPTELPTQQAAPPPHKPSPKYHLNRRLSFAIVGGLVLILLLAAGVWLFLRRGQTPPSDNNQLVLDDDELSKLNVDIQKPDRTLTIAASGVFKGNLLVEKDLTINGKLNLSSNTTLGQLEVSGPTTLSGGLTVVGASNFQGSVTISGALAVGGNGTFAGTLGVTSLTTGSLTTSQITIGGHIRTGGATPAISAGSGSGGGSATILGNDTAGTVTINTGGVGTGSLATVRFRTVYGIAPRVTITPVGSNTANLRFYVDRNADFFTIGTISATTPNTSYVFDYHVTE